MSKSTKLGPEVTTINSFSVSRFESGYFITKHTIVDGKVTKSEKVSEPDVWAITAAKLSKIIMKEF